MSKAGEFQEGQRVVYVKRGELRCYDTEWPATYIRRNPFGRHSIRIDGRKRISVVTTANLVAVDPPPPGERGCVVCGKQKCSGHQP